MTTFEFAQESIANLLSGAVSASTIQIGSITLNSTTVGNPELPTFDCFRGYASYTQNTETNTPSMGLCVGITPWVKNSMGIHTAASIAKARTKTKGSVKPGANASLSPDAAIWYRYYATEGQTVALQEQALAPWSTATKDTREAIRLAFSPCPNDNDKWQNKLVTDIERVSANLPDGGFVVAVVANVHGYVLDKSTTTKFPHTLLMGSYTLYAIPLVSADRCYAESNQVVNMAALTAQLTSLQQAIASDVIISKPKIKEQTISIPTPKEIEVVAPTPEVKAEIPVDSARRRPPTTKTSVSTAEDLKIINTANLDFVDELN